MSFDSANSQHPIAETIYKSTNGISANQEFLIFNKTIATLPPVTQHLVLSNCRPVICSRIIASWIVVHHLVATPEIKTRSDSVIRFCQFTTSNSRNDTYIHQRHFGKSGIPDFQQDYRHITTGHAASCFVESSVSDM